MHVPQSLHQYQLEKDVRSYVPLQQKKRPLISCITVNYHADALVKRLIMSIAQTAPVPFEVIVCDNSMTNRGYGTGCNMAAAHARGAFIYIINPDAYCLENTLAVLLRASQALHHSSVLAPQLLDEDMSPYLSTTQQLGWIQLAVAHSVLNTIWPTNPVSTHFWNTHLPLSESRFVENASGAALFIPQRLWRKIGGFDEHFFLYFEDNDLCRRLRQQQIPIRYEAGAQLVHPGGAATPNRTQARRYFYQSRWRYSRKYFGILAALAVEGWLRVSDLAATVIQRVVTPSRRIRNTK